MQLVGLGSPVTTTHSFHDPDMVVSSFWSPVVHAIAAEVAFGTAVYANWW